MFSRWKRSEKVDSFELSPSDPENIHVLAVDDSLVDRLVIERLLKISSCKGTCIQHSDTRTSNLRISAFWIEVLNRFRQMFSNSSR